MIVREGSRMRIEGPVTVDNVKSILAQGHAAIAAGVIEADLSGLGQTDSSMIAMMLAWKRTLPALAFSGMKQDLASLAKLYGLNGLFPGT